MTNHKKTGSTFSSIYAGIGFGLLMGLIMGLSISPTVKIVIGTLASLLGALLGFENKLGKAETSEYSTLERNLKLGSFGFAVVAGILVGISIRTNDLFAPTISERVQAWIDAGYDSTSARKYVLYEKLRIDPSTGEATAESEALLKKNLSALFNSSEEKTISTQLDTVLFNGSIEVAKSNLKKLDNDALSKLIAGIAEELPAQKHMIFISILQQMTYKMEMREINYCKLSTDTLDWSDPLSRKLADLLIDVDYNSRNSLVEKTKAFFCTLK